MGSMELFMFVGDLKEVGVRRPGNTYRNRPVSVWSEAVGSGHQVALPLAVVVVVLRHQHLGAVYVLDGLQQACRFVHGHLYVLEYIEQVSKRECQVACQLSSCRTTSVQNCFLSWR